MTYTYKCPACSKIRTIQRGMNDPRMKADIYCQDCGVDMDRVYDVPTIKFIGKGFHCNDYKKEKK
jgi:predicted nucleic acid-binding Zn ribbon protein